MEVVIDDTSSQIHWDSGERVKETELDIPIVETIKSNLIENEDSSSISSNNVNEIINLNELKASNSKKNLYIKELLADYKASEEENKMLKEKIVHLKENLSEATLYIQTINVLCKNVKSENLHYIEQIEGFKKVQVTLQLQAEELTVINKNQEHQIEDFIQQMDIKLNEWKGILEIKDAKISNLNDEINELKKYISSFDKGNTDFVKQMVDDRDGQIIVMEKNLFEATQNMINSAKKIKKLKSEIYDLKSTIKKLAIGYKEPSEELQTFETLKNDLEKYQKHTQVLEDCLRTREIEIADTLGQINVADDEMFKTIGGVQNKRILKQLNVRDKQIIDLVAENNNYQHLINQIQFENIEMRKKLNLSSEETIVGDNETNTIDNGKYKMLINDLHNKLASINEENILLQIRLRQKEKNIKKLYEYLNNIGIKIPENFISIILSECDTLQQAFEENNNSIEIEKILPIEKSPVKNQEQLPVDSKDENLKNDYTVMKERYQELVDENEGLRKGLHEILTAVKEKVSDSSCDIDLPSVESLLNVMDSRHVAGWYHPAMRMLMELNYEKGFQNNLRIMLKEARIEVTSTLNLLYEERQKNLDLEKKLSESINKEHLEILNNLTPKENNNDENLEKTYVPQQKSDVKTSELNFSFFNKANRSYELIIHQNLTHFHKKFEMLYENMMELFSQNNADKSKWRSMEEHYKHEIENLTALLNSMKTRLDGVEKLKNYPTKQSKTSDSKNTFKSKDSNETAITNNENSNNIEKDNNINDNKLKHNSDKEVTDINDILYIMENTDDEKVSKIKSFIELYLLTLEKRQYFERKSEYIENMLKVTNTEKDKVENECYDHKMEMFESNKQYEIKIQRLMFENADLRNELRKSVPLGDFINQSEKLNNVIIKYRKMVNNIQNTNFSYLLKGENVSEQNKKVDISQENEAFDPMINSPTQEDSKILHDRIKFLENKYFHLQKKQSELFNTIQSSWLKEEHQKELKKLIPLKKINEDLKIENKELQLKLSTLEGQINDSQQSKLVCDLELNILRHQILDLQSSNDDKAAIARLSSEILISHMHALKMHQKEEMFIKNCENEKQKCKNLETILHEKDVKFTKYVVQTNIKISFLNSIIQMMKEQYQGAIPLISIEDIWNIKLKLNENLKTVQEHENELISLKNDLEHKVVESKIHCMNLDESQCQHYVEMKLNESKYQLINSMMVSKLKKTEEESDELMKNINNLSESLIILTFAFNKCTTEEKYIGNDISALKNSSYIELIDVDSNVVDANIPIPKPRILSNVNLTPTKNENLEYVNYQENKPNSKKILQKHISSKISQTDTNQFYVSSMCQTSVDFKEFTDNKLIKENNILNSNLKQSLALASERAAEILKFQTKNTELESKIENFEIVVNEKFATINKLNVQIKNLENDKTKTTELLKNQFNILELKSVLESMKNMENERDSTTQQYENLMKVERSEHNKTKELAQKEIAELKKHMKSLEDECNSIKKIFKTTSDIDSAKTNYNKILELEDRCFQLKADLDNTITASTSLRLECERWKNLAIERFSNMEILKKQLEERHTDEVISYKSEASHWLTELTSAKDELSDIKIQLNDQRTATLQQISEKNSIIEKFRHTNHYLKQQLLSLQAIISEGDPTFDLTTIAETLEMFDEDEMIDVQRETIINKAIEHSENKNQNFNKNISNTNSFEIYVDKIQKEKQMLTKQNSLLRKQIKILTARERRHKLEYENAKLQIQKRAYVPFPSNKIIQSREEEIVKLNSRIKILESQLCDKSVYREGSEIKAQHLDLWNKQKRWQEASEHWKQKYQNKCGELEQVQRNLESSKNIIQRLERDKRSIESRLSKHSKDGISPSTITGDNEGHLEMLLQDKERLENEVALLKLKSEENIPHNSLIERLEAQQRRIIAFELSEKGKEALVSEYENLLAQNAILTKQNIKLESQFIENILKTEKQIEENGADVKNNCCHRMKQHNEHLENYIKLLKEENSQLVAKKIENDTLLKINMKPADQIKKIANLERTVLTLRGIINKLQSENKKYQSGENNQRDSMPSYDNKIIQELKTEKEELNRIIREKDELLNQAKKLLKKAADKEKQLVEEIKKLTN